MSILALALTYFLVSNSIGNAPTIIALIKDFDFARQRVIMFREGVISLLLALFFQYFGEWFLGMLQVSNYALTLTGGLLLFMTALSMLFHQPETTEMTRLKQEPFIVPIATPLLSGPGLMTIIMVTSSMEQNNFKVSLAIIIAGIGVIGVLMAAPYLQKILGKRGLAALEQIMGMVLGLIAMQMIVNGAHLFVKTLS